MKAGLASNALLARHSCITVVHGDQDKPWYGVMSVMLA